MDGEPHAARHARAPRIPDGARVSLGVWCRPSRCTHLNNIVLKHSHPEVLHASQAQCRRGSRRGPVRRNRVGPDGGQDRSRRPHQRRDRAPGQGQRERCPHGHRGAERQGRDDRRQEGQARAARRRRRGRPEAGHRGRPEAGRLEGQRRRRPPELRHVDPGLEDLQRRRHPADLAVGDQPEVHPQRLQDHLPRRGRRRAAGRHARPLRGQGAEGQEHRRDRRPHRLRPGRRRGVLQGGQGVGRQDRRDASSPTTRRPTSPPS